jgi:FtsP/CotA-like multicopper oxidase with cupredoxin domain
MSRNQRLGLVAAVVAIAVVAFVVAKPGDDDNPRSTGKSQRGSNSAHTDTAADGARGTRPQPAKPSVTRIAIRGGAVRGGPKTITVKKGDAVRIVVTSDAPNSLHLHGFDLEQEAVPGKPARFGFKADIEGEFELESHTFEDAGQEPRVASLRVEPS